MATSKGKAMDDTAERVAARKATPPRDGARPAHGRAELERALVLDTVRVTEQAAIAASRASGEVGAAKNTGSRPCSASAWRYSAASSGMRSVASTPWTPAAAAACAKRGQPRRKNGFT